MKSTLNWARRLGYLEATIEALGYYVDDRMSVRELRKAYAAGDFNQFVSARAKELLHAS